MVTTGILVKFIMLPASTPPAWESPLRASHVRRAGGPAAIHPPKGLFALSERRHRESAVWVVGGLAYVAYYLLHAQAVSAAMLPTD